MSILNAILVIKPDAKFRFEKEDISTLVWSDGNPTNITNEQILAKQTELQTEYDAKQYQRDRELAYPPIGDQLDMQYWDKVNGTSTWQDAVAEVKSDFPKP
jgi:hypothetical protein